MTYHHDDRTIGLKDLGERREAPTHCLVRSVGNRQPRRGRYGSDLPLPLGQLALGGVPR